MIMNASVMIWLAGACAVLGLAIYRKVVALREDDNLHLRVCDVPQVNQQAAVASRLDVVDKWGVKLTIGVTVFGILLAAVFIYQQWALSLQVQP